jgi:hypothetical protein
MESDKDQVSFDESRYEWQVVDRVDRGEPGAALLAVDLAAFGLLRRSISPCLADYLAQALDETYRAIKAGARPGDAFEKAFRLERQRGRPVSQRTTDRDFDVALWVHLAVHGYGLSLKDAKIDAADVFNVANVERCLRSTGKITDVPLENAKQFFIDRGRRLPG